MTTRYCSFTIGRSGLGGISAQLRLPHIELDAIDCVRYKVYTREPTFG